MNVKSGLRSNRLQPALIALTFLLAAYNLAAVMINHYFLRSFTWDYGAYNFAFYDFAHLGLHPNYISRILIPYDVHFLQDHISFTLPLLSPLYWVLSPIAGTYSLLMIQWVFIIYGAWGTYKLILLKTQNKNFSLLAVIFYFVLYGRYSSLQADCNLAIMGASMLPVFFYYFESSKYKASIATFIFLCLNREDMPLCLLFISAYLMITNRMEKQKFKLAGIFVLISALYFIFTFSVLIPFFEDENKKFRLFDYGILGEGPLSALQFVVMHPFQSFRFLFMNHLEDPAFDGVKASFYLLYGACGGFLLFWRPLYFICLIPFIAKKMFNDSPLRWGTENYYSIEFVCLLPIFVFSILGGIKKEQLRNITATLLCVVSLAFTYYFLEKSLNGGMGNRKINVFSQNFYKSEQDVSSIHKLISLIPDNSSVSASGDLIPHLSFRLKMFYYPSMGDCEFVCVNKRSNTYPVTAERFTGQMDSLLRSKNWQLVGVADDVYLLRNRR